MLTFKQFLEAGWHEDPEHVFFNDKHMNKFLNRDQLQQMYAIQAKKDNDDRQKEFDAQVKRGEVNPNDPDLTQIYHDPRAQQAKDAQQDTQIQSQGLQSKVGELEKRLRDLEQTSDIGELQKRVAELEKLFQTARQNSGETVDKFKNINPPGRNAA